MSSGFISETELANQRQKRQEEWAKVRTADQPEEAPEEPYDPRSLFERLQEQKQKKDFEYEEAHKLKNMIKGLDDDEVDFLDLVDKAKLEEEKKKYLEEKNELNEFRLKRTCLEEEHLAERIKAEITVPNNVSKQNSNKISSQSKLLAGAVVKKSSTGNNTTSNVSGNSSGKRKLEEDDEDALVNKKVANSTEPISTSSTTSSSSPVMKCVGVLPGIGSYDDESSDSADSSSDFESDGPQYDLCGRKITKKKNEEEEEETSKGR